MATSYKKGSFAANTVTGNQAVTGVGFQPKALRVWVTAQAAEGYAIHERVSRGMATSSTQRACVGYSSDDAAATMIVARSLHIDRIINLLAGATTPTVDAVADLVSFDTDGFTINWSDAPAAAVVVHYEAYGGTDITNAKVGTVTLATAGATASFTDPGFQPDFLELLDIGLTATGDSASSANLSVGAASGSAAQAFAMTGEADGSSTGQTAVYQRSGSILAQVFTTATPTERYRCSLASFDATGFTLNNDAIPDIASIVPYLAIKGGRWKVGVETQGTATGTKTTSGLGVGTVKGVSFFGCNNTASTVVQNVSAKMSWGGSDGTTEGHVWFSSTDAAATSDSNQRTVTTKAFGHSTNPSTTDAEADCTALGDSSFTLDWTTADATAREFVYIVCGDNAGGVTVTPGAATATGSAAGQAVLVSVLSSAAVSAGLAPAASVANTVPAAAAAAAGTSPAPTLLVIVPLSAATAAGSAPPAAPGQTATPAAASATGAAPAPQTRILIPAAAAVALGLAPTPTVLTGALVVPAAVTVTDDGQTIILITDPIDTTVTVTMADIAP